MPALVAGIHVFSFYNRKQDVDARVKPGHDDGIRRSIIRPQIILARR
jgi:hypothetical protein